MPTIRISVADVELRLTGPDLAELLKAVHDLLPMVAAVDREVDDDLEDRPPLGFSATVDLDPDRQRLTEPVWFADEE